MGKSGHIGRKIASTLSSTGTSSVFLHPAEALHGDFGTLQPGDCLLAIAFGGETSEVLRVAEFARRSHIPVVAITGRADSSLARLADHVLDGSIAREACPLNLAPTTSTTVALALGDALAVALMRARGFTPHDFARLHPDGSLGRKLSLVKQYMREESTIARITPETSFHDVLEAVTRNNFGIVAVLNPAKQLIGAITDGDLRRAVLKHDAKAMGLKASDLMSGTPKTITPEELAVDAVAIMENHKITSLFVVKSAHDRELRGLLRLHDLLEAKIV
jgi:arabinose-5-phosphate isomerase